MKGGGIGLQWSPFPSQQSPATSPVSFPSVNTLSSVPPPDPLAHSALVTLAYFWFLEYQMCYFPQGLCTSSFISFRSLSRYSLLREVSPDHTT